MKDINNDAENYPINVHDNIELFLWKQNIEQNNYERLYFDEIEKYLGESILNGLNARYGIKSKKAANKSVMIETQLKKIKEMNPITKVGYNAKRAGENIYFTSSLLVREIEIFLKEGHLMPDLRGYKIGEKGLRFTNSSEGLSTINIHDQIIFLAIGIAYATFEIFLNEELSKLKIDSKPVENISQIDLINIKSKILVLRELGIIELLNQRFHLNNSKIADCIGAIINVKPTSIRGILSNMNGNKNNNINPENKGSLENAITVLNDLGCFNEVINLQNKLGKLI